MAHPSHSLSVAMFMACMALGRCIFGRAATCTSTRSSHSCTVSSPGTPVTLFVLGHVRGMHGTWPLHLWQGCHLNLQKILTLLHCQQANPQMSHCFVLGHVHGMHGMHGATRSSHSCTANKPWHHRHTPNVLGHVHGMHGMHGACTSTRSSHSCTTSSHGSQGSHSTPVNIICTGPRFWHACNAHCYLNLHKFLTLLHSKRKGVTRKYARCNPMAQPTQCKPGSVSQC